MQPAMSDVRLCRSQIESLVIASAYLDLVRRRCKNVQNTGYFTGIANLCTCPVHFDVTDVVGIHSTIIQNFAEDLTLSPNMGLSNLL